MEINEKKLVKIKKKLLKIYKKIAKYLAKNFSRFIMKLWFFDRIFTDFDKYFYTHLTTILTFLQIFDNILTQK